MAKINTGFYLDQELMDWLKKVADSNSRSVSNMLTIILRKEMERGK